MSGRNEKQLRGEKKYRLVRLLGHYNLKDEQQFLRFWKWMIFAVLLLVEGLMLLGKVEWLLLGRWWDFFPLLGMATLLAVAEAIKLFCIKNDRWRLAFCVLCALLACSMLWVTTGTYMLVLYALIMTEFYMSTKKFWPSFLLFVASACIFSVCNMVFQYWLNDTTSGFLQPFTQSFGMISALAIYFVVIRIAVAFYRQFVQLDMTLNELAESKEELQEAYDKLAEVTALKERQRIAKDIHDTAGHSITTVIMQTEAAKLIIDNNPADAKKKIVAANLQAKHALEELRNSVHLLSDHDSTALLKDKLERVLQETADGTGIKIRSEIENVLVDSERRRFLCNTLKEGIANGIRHGGATAFWFECKQQGRDVHFLLSDNGKGLENGGLHLGFGLTSMQASAQALGGTVRFESEEGEGFEIQLTLPVDGTN
ncbi:MAG: hypothetical protein IJV85_02580 [Clostridia bacterium]|nr:hypothetical protein [Clostridia bacterium]